MRPVGDVRKVRCNNNGSVTGFLCAKDGGLSALNFSGSNPVFASIGTQVFRSRKLPILSLANRDDKLIWLAVPEGIQPDTGIEANTGLTLKEHLALAGRVQEKYVE